MKPDVFPANDLNNANGGLPESMAGYGRRLLAEGDSWFTIGGFGLVTNLVKELECARSQVVINCAYPGDELQRMVDRRNDQQSPCFKDLLNAPRQQRFWEAILISAGGNDLMVAAKRSAAHLAGEAVPLGDRLLLTPAEAAAANPGVVDASRYISEPGWTRFAQYLKANFAILVDWRDAGDSRNSPLVAHTYHVPVVRPAGVGAGSSRQGWLLPGLIAWEIPAVDRQPLIDALFERLRALLLSLDSASGSPDALPNFHVFDIAGRVALTPADPASTGDSNDWQNEIHPNRSGYRKIGRAMGPWLDALLP